MRMILKAGELENIVLNALWELENQEHGKIFVSDIQDKIIADRSDSKEWAYTTVKTVLDRLVEKEIALRLREGKRYHYQSVVQRDEAGLLALSKLIHQYFRNDMNQLEHCLKRLRETRSTERSGKSKSKQESELITA